MTFRLLFVVGFLLLAACQSPQMTEVDLQPSAKRKFETAIADAIFNNVSDELPTLAQDKRTAFLQKKLNQLDRSVNFDLTDRRSRRNREILAYLLASEEASTSDDYLVALRRMTSLNWELDEFEARISGELDRLDQMIAAFSLQQNSDQAFDLAQHMQEAKRSTTFPEDSFEGKQQYLDQLADDMVTAQLDWFDTLKSYEASEISLEGTEDESISQVFQYAYPNLVIDLTHVDSLPLFETRAVAIYFGFPGLHSLLSAVPQESIQHLLVLPGFNHGWASYIADYTGSRDSDAPLHHMYRARLLAALALADLRLHSGSWQITDAANYLAEPTPYSKRRLQRAIEDVTKNPGFHAAALAGKLTFMELHDACISHSEACSTTGFHQAIVEGGPMPSNLLRVRLLSIN